MKSLNHSLEPSKLNALPAKQCLFGSSSLGLMECRIWKMGCSSLPLQFASNPMTFGFHYGHSILLAITSEPSLPLHTSFPLPFTSFLIALSHLFFQLLIKDPFSMMTSLPLLSFHLKLLFCSAIALGTLSFKS